MLDLLHNRTLPYTRGPDERKPPGSPESQVDILGLFCDTDPAFLRLGRLHQTVHGADARKDTNRFACPYLVDNLFFAVRLSAPEGFHMAGCIPFPPFQCSRVTSPMKHGGTG